MSNRLLTGLEVSILSHVIDDDPDTALIIEQLLRANNIRDFQIHTKADEFLSHLNADIIVCAIDYYLTAGLTGIDVLRAVKSKNKGSFVILLSGTQSYKTVIDAVNAGADRYVDKNDPDYLQKLVEYMLEGLNEAKKRWGLMSFLETQMKNRNLLHDDNGADN